MEQREGGGTGSTEGAEAEWSVTAESLLSAGRTPGPLKSFPGSPVVHGETRVTETATRDASRLRHRGSPSSHPWQCLEARPPQLVQAGGAAGVTEPLLGVLLVGDTLLRGSWRASAGPLCGHWPLLRASHCTPRAGFPATQDCPSLGSVVFAA